MFPISIHWILLITIGWASYQAFENIRLREKLTFIPGLISSRKEWYRMFSCAWVHADFNHLLINLIVLWSFGEMVSARFKYFWGSSGDLAYLALFILGVFASNISTFFKHRNDPYYRAVGASGGVSAVVFASILMEPSSKLLLFFILPIPAILFGVAYLVYSSVMSKKTGDFINHDAHFWGGVFGFVFTAAMRPSLLSEFVQKIALMF